MNIAALAARSALSLVSAVTSRSSDAAKSAQAGPATANPLSLPPMPPLSGESLEAETAKFFKETGNLFRQAGIRVPPEALLGNDWQGQVVVSNDHPDKAKIEQMFRDHPDLQQDFARLSGSYSLKRAAEGYDRYAKRYAELQGNPAAQAALVEAEIARNKAPFYLSLGSQGAEPVFGLSGLSA